MSWNYLMVLIQSQIFKIVRNLSKKKKKKKKTTLPTNSPNNVYIYRINNRWLFKIKDGYRLELQLFEAMTLFGSLRKWMDKTKNGENVPGLEIVELVLVQCNLVDNLHQQETKALNTFMPN